jgi:hypothetical protein
MARQFNLDQQAAREANTGGKRITETGKYKGTIVVAFYEKNDKGTESMNIMFKSDAGQEAGPLNIYTHNGQGSALAGYKLVNAIMTCCRVKSLTPVAAPVQLYDFNSQSAVTKQKEIYKELTGRPIGLVLQQEEYQKQDQSIGERMVISAPFEAGSELMAMEILDKRTVPEQLGKYMGWIGKNPVRRLRKQQAPTAAAYAAQAPITNDFDDDIPF